jgi:hypothetical protein
MKYLVGIITVTLLLLACSENSPVNTDEKDFRGSISGLILDQFGEPISGVAITANDSGFNSNSGADGSYSIPDVNSGIYTLLFTRPGFFDTTADSTIDIATAEEIVNINMTMYKITGNITGSVVDENGDTLTDVSILATATNMIEAKEISPDTTGVFTLSSLQLDVYSLTISKPHYTTQVVTCTLSTTNYNLNIEAELKKKVATLNGTIKDQADNKLTGVTVTLSSVGAVTASDGVSATTDTATGSFLMQEVHHGTYLATFTKDEYTQVQLPCTLSFAKETTSLAVKMTYNPDGGNLTGVVKDNNGDPVGGVAVSVSGEIELTTDTKADGTFIFEWLRLGDYQVEVNSEGIYSDTVLIDSVTITKDSTIDLGEIVVTKQLEELIVGSATGVVNDTAGLPLSGITVTLSNDSITEEGTTLGDGTYSITDIPVGTYEVTFSGQFATSVTLADSITIVDGESFVIPTTVVIVDIPSGTVTGTLLSTGGAPDGLGSWTVSLSGTSHSATGNSTGTSVTYTITGVPAGTYTVVAVSATHPADSVTGIKVVVDSTSNVAEIPLTFDATLSKRSANGTFAIIHKDKVDSVAIEYMGSGIPVWVSVPASYDNNNCTFSGVMNVSASGTLWMARVKAFNSAGRKIGQSGDVTFTSGGGDVEFPLFTNPTNALPTVQIAGNNLTATIDSTFELTADENDPFDNDIRSFTWHLNDEDGTVKSGKSVTFKYQEEKKFYPTVTVVDGDGNSATSPVYSVSVVNPNATIGANELESRTVTIIDNVAFTVNVVDDDEVKEIIWNWGEGAEVKTLGSTTSAKSHSYGSAGNYTVRVKSVDKWDDTTAFASVIVKVTNDAPTLTIGTVPVSIFSGETVTIPFTTSDDGTVEKYEYSLNGGSYIEFTPSSNSFTFTAPEGDADANYSISIKVTDEDSRTTIKTATTGLGVWAKKLGNELPNKAYYSIETSDGGFLATGYTQNTESNCDIWVVKFNSKGDTLWSRTYADGNIDIGFQVLEASDGYIIISGYGSYNSPWIIKVDDNGGFIWSQKYPEKRFSGGRDPQTYAALTSNGDIIISGNEYINESDMWLARINGSDGAIIWEELYDLGTEEKTGEYGYSIIATSDNNFVVTGYCGHSTESSTPWLVKINGEGVVVWSRIISKPVSSRYYYPYSVIEMSDGRLVIYGNETSNPFLITTDSDGTNSQWAMLTNKPFYRFTIAESYQNKVVRTAKSNGSDLFLENTLLGGVSWESSMGTPNTFIQGIEKTSDKGYILSGSSDYSINKGDFYLIKTDKDGNTVPLQ